MKRKEIKKIASVNEKFFAVKHDAAFEFRRTHSVVHTSRHSLLFVHLQQSTNAQTIASDGAETARVLLLEEPLSAAGLLGRTTIQKLTKYNM